MDFTLRPEMALLLGQVRQMVHDEIIPRDEEFLNDVGGAGDRFQFTPRQVFGATGISQDTPLASMWLAARTLRFADGPDAVHRRQIGRAELRKDREVQR